MSEWQSPQDYPRRETDGIKRLVDAVASTHRQVRESTSNLLRTAGILVKPGRITSTDFDGVDHSSLGTRGWSLGRDDDAQRSYLAVNGLDVYEALQAQIDAVETAQAALEQQQDALTALVAGQVAFGSASPATAMGWSVSGSGVFSTKASTSVGVPAGYSRALVLAIGSVTYQTPGPTNRFDIRVGIGGDFGAQLPNLAEPVGCSSGAHTRTYSGLNGGSISLDVQVAVAVPEGASAANTATVTGLALFLR